MATKSERGRAAEKAERNGREIQANIQERPGFRANGFGVLAALLGWLGVAIALMVTTAGELEGAHAKPGAGLWIGIGMVVVFSIACKGFYTLQPNEARVLVFLGSYAGSVRDPGFWWSNPLAERKALSLRVRNFNSEKLKVNDAQGNPIEIAAVVVWRVVDTARAAFDVDRYESFVSIQSETAIRALASRYAYDAHEPGTESLRGSPDGVSTALRHELEARLELAGVSVSEARISHLAYAPEIAQAMLRRQQASAVIAARQLIVEGAVGMVEMALKQLSEHKVVELDEERKAAMVSNLLVVLVSESETHPVVNAGTLY